MAKVHPLRGAQVIHDWGNGEVTLCVVMVDNTYPDELHQAVIECADLYQRTIAYLKALDAIDTHADEAG